MRPFLLLSSRAEDLAADEEYAAFLRYTGLAEDELHRVRMEAGPLPALDLDRYAGVFVGGGPFNSSDPPAGKSADITSGTVTGWFIGVTPHAGWQRPPVGSRRLLYPPGKARAAEHKHCGQRHCAHSRPPGRRTPVPFLQRKSAGRPCPDW